MIEVYCKFEENTFQSYCFLIFFYKRLLKANRHLNDEAANILLERALVVHENKLEFSRDMRLKVTVSRNQ